MWRMVTSDQHLHARRYGGPDPDLLHPPTRPDVAGVAYQHPMTRSSSLRHTRRRYELPDPDCPLGELASCSRLARSCSAHLAARRSASASRFTRSAARAARIRSASDDHCRGRPGFRFSSVMEPLWVKVDDRTFLFPTPENAPQSRIGIREHSRIDSEGLQRLRLRFRSSGSASRSFARLACSFDAMMSSRAAT